MASLKTAVNAMCKSCCYDKAEAGSWREQVENCHITKCPLWEVRPLSVATTNANRKPRTKKFTLIPA